MSFFGLLLLIFIGYFIVWPLVKVYLKINRARNAYREAFSSQRTQRRESERKAGWSKPNTTRKKKIGNDIGEYVAFEETSAPETNDRNRTRPTSTITEQQIEDAEWEDI